MNHLKIMLIELYEFQKSVLSFHLDLEFSFGSWVFICLSRRFTENDLYFLEEQRTIWTAKVV